MQSLHSFCKTHGLSKTTVYRHLTDRGFDLSQGLTDAAVEEVTYHFRLSTPEDLPTTPTQVMGHHPGYADPFAGVGGSALVPVGFAPQSRALATQAAAQRVQQICQGANLHTQQTVQAALESGDQMGQQLGAFLAERTIAAAEQQRQALIAEYLHAQGVQTAPKSEGA